MAYARFGLKSDVYVFRDSSQHYVCCGCIRPSKRISFSKPDRIFKTPASMLKHVVEHFIHGDRVPPAALNRLIDEIASQ